ncbi:unknown [Eggerthella sp. CAG:368]|nr:unknown [Eggerthella sp. CAG:368]
MEKESAATEKGHQGAEENTAPLPVESVVEASVAAVADAALL